MSFDMPRRLIAALDILEQKNCVLDVIECIDTVCIFLKNVINFPTEKKFRKIRINNIDFAERVANFPGGLECLEAVGFVKEIERDALVMEPELHLEEQYTLRELRDIALNRLLALNAKFQVLERIHDFHPWNTIAGAGFADDIGRRTTMEDDHILIDEFAGYSNLAYFGLYDGHGGRDAVEFVVRGLHANLAHSFRDRISSNIAEDIKAAYLATDNQLRRRNIWDSGTTCVSVLLHKISPEIRLLYCANAGDSRAVLCRNGEAVRLSKDHKPQDEEETKRIQAEGGFVGNHGRVNGVLAVSRALGDHMLKPYVSCDPHITTTRLKTSDLFMIVACDGLWDVCTDQEAVDLVLQGTLRMNVKPKKELKERRSAAQGSSSRRSNKQGVASVNDIFGGNTRQRPESTTSAPVSPDTTEERIDKIPDKITGKMRSRAVAELPTVARRLVDMALERRSLDNVSVLVVWF
eukprot:TRINITY_DN5891_c0_g1_i2.p1 TRINITY_DN5891_c0_g1~~TRINITY_DN5891_c0_g1_i2.p1  ORF type:complete len:464 (-),score=121.07 TRINITY_DN5891_c0_g1_i2:53-1444(-)